MRSPSRLLIVGLVAVAAFVVVGLVLVQRVGTTYADGLEVAADSARWPSTPPSRWPR